MVSTLSDARGGDREESSYSIAPSMIGSSEVEFLGNCEFTFHGNTAMANVNPSDGTRISCRPACEAVVETHGTIKGGR
jgi:hypothetical protein